MNSNDRLLLRNIGIAAAVVIGAIALFSFVANPVENSFMGNVDEFGNPVEDSCIQIYIDKMVIACQGDYVEWGHDSPEQCLEHYMTRLPDC